MRWSALVVAACLSSTAAAQPAPPDKQACFDSYVTAQKRQREGALIAAREALLVCSQPACPEPVPAHCAQWLLDVDRRLPSVVIRARTSDGRDVSDAAVEVDGKPFATRLDGRAQPVDPGPHRLRLQPAEGLPVETRLVINEGEKSRLVTLTLAEPTEQPAARPAMASWIAAGVGAGALVTAGIVGASAWSARSDLESCKPYCDAGDVSAVRRRFLVADLGAAVGVVAIGLAVYWWRAR